MEVSKYQGLTNKQLDAHWMASSNDQKSKNQFRIIAKSEGH